MLKIFLIPFLFGLTLPIQENSQTVPDRQEHLAGKVKFIRLEKETPASLNQGYEQPRRVSELISYDEAGRKNGTVYYNDEATQLWRWAIRFDSKGREDTFLTYDENDSLTSTTEIVYDSEGRKVEELDYKADGKPNGKTVYKYGQQGRLIKEIVYKADGTTCVERRYTYDQKARLASESEDKCDCCPAHGARRWDYIYDSDGNIVEWKAYETPSSGYRGKTVYSYDRRGNVTEESSYDSADILMSKYVYTYEFDFAGNWTKKIPSVVYKDSSLRFHYTEVIYRTITYY